MKRTTLLATLALILILLLGACGGSASEPAATDQGSQATESGESSAPLVCNDPLGCVEVGPDDPIVIASALVITGPNEQLGLDSQYGVEIAIDFYGPVLGRTVQLQAEDDGCNAEGGQTAAQKIVSNPQIVGVIGTSCSGAGVPASRIISDAGYLMISPSNTAPVLTDEATHQAGYLRTAHNDKVQGRAMAEYAIQVLGVQKAAAIHDGDPYTEGLASVFRDSFIDLGGEIVAFEGESADATNVEPLLRTVAAAGPEFIYYPVFVPLGSLITKTARELPDLQDVYLAGADGVQSPDFLSAAGSAAEGMFVSGPDLGFANETYDRMVAAYREKYGTAPLSVFHAHAFDATMLLLKAVEQVAQQGGDGTLLIGRQALRDTLFATSGYQGVTGTLTCNQFGDCADPKIAVSIVENGAFKAIWP